MSSQLFMLVIALTLYIAAVSCDCGKFGRRAICVQECNSDWDCGSGQVCKSNGCGNVCRYSSVIGKRADMELCAPPCNCYCPHGFQKDQRTGCEICKCAHQP